MRVPGSSIVRTHPLPRFFSFYLNSLVFITVHNCLLLQTVVSLIYYHAWENGKSLRLSLYVTTRIIF